MWREPWHDGCSRPFGARLAHYTIAGNKSKNKKEKRIVAGTLTPSPLIAYNIPMTQLELDFDVDCNEGELFFDSPKLQDPCVDCNEREAEYTIPRTGDGVCGICAESRSVDWIERHVDRY